jgi:hypothetical protein
MSFSYICAAILVGWAYFLIWDRKRSEAKEESEKQDDAARANEQLKVA